MLMVLMALIEFGKTKFFKLTRFLWLLVSGGIYAGGNVSCGGGGGGDDQGGKDAIEETLTDVLTVDQTPQEGVIPNEGAQDCVPKTYYGPTPCNSDDECIKSHGPNWYCNKSHFYSDPCGPIFVPICEEKKDVDVYETKDVTGKDCEPKTYYGPPPCNSDDECIKQYGPNWYCDKENAFNDPCGPVSWPMCKQKPDVDVIPSETVDCGNVPVPLYGVPVVCQNDEWCHKEFGPEYYCDKSDPCKPPQCKKKE